jgi:predicted nucleic acid-binding protein
MDEREQSHARCAQLFAETPDPIVVPAPVLVELDWMGRSFGRRMVTDTTLKAVEDGSLEVEELTRGDYLRVRALCRRYEDLPLGLVDASVIAVAERLGETAIVTLDRRHFSVVRPRHVAAFELLP